ncbi:kisspeptin 2 [Centroberyx gerrardi]|uniref:kisspeptin 2 n=1 Tax=Centroberyx gerrardi TaxID=166262 RepID=UPI003AAEACE3
MRILALILVYGLILRQDGGSFAASLRGFESSQWTHTIGFPQLSEVKKRAASDFGAEDPNLCFSLRENDDQRQLLCNDRRSKFNFNPFGLRFGKRYNGYLHKRALKRPRTNQLLPVFLFPRELEVPT